MTSLDSSSTSDFHTADYVLIGSVVLIPVVVGTILSIFFKRWSFSQLGRVGNGSFSSGGSEEYFFARQTISSATLALSLSMAFSSAITVQGFVEEVYFEGPGVLWLLLPQLLALSVTALIFAPVYHRLYVTSIFNYLELRFNTTVRRAASALFVVQSVFVASLALYAPAKLLAEHLSNNTGEVMMMIDAWMVVAVTAAATGIYTALGGFRTVVYTSALTWLVMLSGLILLVGVAALRVGGIDAVLFYHQHYNDSSSSSSNTTTGASSSSSSSSALAELANVLLLDATINENKNFLSHVPFERHSIWTLCIGGFFTFLAYTSASETAAHRYMTTPLQQQQRRQVDGGTTPSAPPQPLLVNYLSSSWKILLYHGLFIIPVNILLWLLGLIVAQQRSGNKKIIFSENNFEISPEKNILSQFLHTTHADPLGYGWYFSATFLAIILTASVGCLACTLNSLALLIMEDFVLPCFMTTSAAAATSPSPTLSTSTTPSPVPDSRSRARLDDWDAPATTVNKLLLLSDRRIVHYAMLVTLFMAFLIAVFACIFPFDWLVLGDGGNLLEFALLIISALGGPLLGVMLGGMFVPMFNAAGAVAGLILALVVNGYFLALKLLLWSPPTEEETTSMFSFLQLHQEISYILLSLVGVVITLAVGIIIGLLACVYHKCLWCCGHGVLGSCPSFMVNNRQKKMLWWHIVVFSPRRRQQHHRNRAAASRQAQPQTATAPPYNFVFNNNNNSATTTRRREQFDRINLNSGATSPLLLMQQTQQYQQPSPRFIILGDHHRAEVIDEHGVDTGDMVVFSSNNAHTSQQQARLQSDNIAGTGDADMNNNEKSSLAPTTSDIYYQEVLTDQTSNGDANSVFATVNHPRAHSASFHQQRHNSIGKSYSQHQNVSYTRLATAAATMRAKPVPPPRRPPTILMSPETAAAFAATTAANNTNLQQFRNVENINSSNIGNGFDGHRSGGAVSPGISNLIKQLQTQYHHQQQHREPLGNGIVLTTHTTGGGSNDAHALALHDGNSV